MAIESLPFTQYTDNIQKLPMEGLTKKLKQNIGEKVRFRRQFELLWRHQAGVFKSAGASFGQMTFFIEFLILTGLYTKWIDTCPLRYQGLHCSKMTDLLGTLFLSILSGHKPYSHITTLRSDGVMPELLGMSSTVSKYTVRRGLMAIEEEVGRAWLQSHLEYAAWPLLSATWILDVDVTVKPLYGHQESAVLGYNPKNSRRPSHTCNNYQMAGLRLVLGVEVEAANQIHSNISLPGLFELMDRLPSEKRPKCVEETVDLVTTTSCQD